MTNHVHLLVTPENIDSIGKTMQSTGCRYVHYFNAAYQRTGTLWEGRYKSLLIDSETYLFTCQRYIEMNPVRAGMVKHPGCYPWSSYRHNVMGVIDPLVSEHPLYQSLGSESAIRQSAYRSVFDLPSNEEEINRIRLLTNQEWVLGSEQFKFLVRQKLNRRIDPLPRGGDRKSGTYQQSRASIKQH
jgi:putative transposase